MAKKNVVAIVKIQIPAGQASPAPPVGTALGPHGVAIMDFCKEYNAKTEAQKGTIIPVEITIFEDRTFTFILKTPPTSVLIKEAAQVKLPDLNTDDIDAAKLQIAGTARSMGIQVVD